jgi:hypothetical protein
MYQHNNPEPHIHFSKGTLINGNRLRAIGNNIYTTPCNYPFHEFLEDFAIGLIDEKWWLSQEGMPIFEQSALFRHAYAHQKNKFDAIKQNKKMVPCTGSNVFWMSLGYDLLCLHHKFAPPPSKVMKRLIDRGSFQSARYEIAIAATLLKSGCNVYWHNEATLSRKHGEFIATHRTTGVRFEVEVKSKPRDGVLNENGTLSDEFKGSEKLLKTALGQAPYDMPYIIFIDLNLPYQNKPENEKAISIETRKLIKKCSYSLLKKNGSYSLIITTNFPFHYDDIDSTSLTPEIIFCPPIDPAYFPLPQEIQDDIKNSLLRYGVIPEEA